MFQMENTKIGIAFHDDGTTSFFAELEKSSAKQREHIEEAREEKRAEKKAAEKKAEKELQNYAKSSTDTKRTSVWADSLLSCKLDAPVPCRLDAPDFDVAHWGSADCLHQHQQVI